MGLSLSFIHYNTIIIIIIIINHGRRSIRNSSRTRFRCGRKKRPRRKFRTTRRKRSPKKAKRRKGKSPRLKTKTKAPEWKKLINRKKPLKARVLFTTREKKTKTRKEAPRKRR